MNDRLQRFYRVPSVHLLFKYMCTLITFVGINDLFFHQVGLQLLLWLICILYIEVCTDILCDILCVSIVLGTLLNIYIFTSGSHLVAIPLLLLPLLVQHHWSKLVLCKLLRKNWIAFLEVRFGVFWCTHLTTVFMNFLWHKIMFGATSKNVILINDSGKHIISCCM